MMQKSGCKWAFKTKCDYNGNIERYNANLLLKILLRRMTLTIRMILIIRMTLTIRKYFSYAADPQVTSYAGQTSKINSYPLHRAGQPNPHFTDQKHNRPLRNGSTHIVTYNSNSPHKNTQEHSFIRNEHKA